MASASPYIILIKRPDLPVFFLERFVRRISTTVSTARLDGALRSGMTVTTAVQSTAVCTGNRNSFSRFPRRRVRYIMLCIKAAAQGRGCGNTRDLVQIPPSIPNTGKGKSINPGGQGRPFNLQWHMGNRSTSQNPIGTVGTSAGAEVWRWATLEAARFAGGKEEQTWESLSDIPIPKAATRSEFSCTSLATSTSYARDSIHPT